jgi:N-acyl homoserine lactone hydrolase
VPGKPRRRLLRPDADSSAVRLDAILTATVPIPQAYVFRPASRHRLAGFAALLRPGGETIGSPCLAYAARHPDAGAILIDTGFHPDASESARKDFGPLMALLFRGLRPAALGYEQQLRELGIEPAAVERVIMTHLHVDHTSGMRLLPNAKFICSRDEWAAATAARAAGSRGYVRHHLPTDARMELVDVAAGGELHGPFGATIDLLGDGSIRLISTPGHTPGHLSVLLRVAGGQQVLVVGDAAYTLRSVREERLPLFTADDDLYLRSLREIKAFSEQVPEAILVPTHDPTAWHELRTEAPAATGTS